MARSSSSPREARIREERREKRLADQRAYQQAYRERARTERKPTRDDVARMVLFWLFKGLAPEKKADAFRQLYDDVLPMLVAQGFDETKSAERIEEIFDRYESGWIFRGKGHLRDEPDFDEQFGDGR